MKIENKNFFGTLSEFELADFEKANKIELPSDYKAFLLESNGGVPAPNKNVSPETIVTYILGMHNGDYYASLYKHISMFMTRLPHSTFPIATDPFGNLFIMSLHPENYGHIYFWDHEGEPEIQDGHYTDNCYFVAHSFSEFASSLIA
jgi:hypothetical protein